MITRRHAAGLAAASILAPAWRANAAATPPTIEELTRAPTLVDASLSPDGKTIAVLREQHEGGKRNSFISLVQADNLAAEPTWVIVGDLKVAGLVWANAERLLVRVYIEREGSYTPTGSRVPETINLSTLRMLSVSVNGGPPALMFGQERDMLTSDPDLAQMIDLLPDDPQHVLMRGWDARRGVYGIYKVDVFTGAAVLVEHGGSLTFGWQTQNGRAVLRYDRLGRSSMSMFMRPAGSDNWTFVRKIRSNDSELWRPDFDVLGPTDEPGVFYVAAPLPGDPATPIRTYDFRSLKFGDVIAARPEWDVAGALIDARGKLIAARFTTDRNEYQFSDASFSAHFVGIDRFFKGDASVRLTGFDLAQQRFLAVAEGPRIVRETYFYDRVAKRLQVIGQSHPWLQHDSLAPVENLDVQTRDGVALRAYLTVPLQAGPRPLIVLPHGGPEVRDSYGFDVVAQAFASQGWLVVQPNFRGSDGYGRAFADAGRKRWGDRMQEDVDDAVTHVLATGRADPKKVAIWGASYGGYAALMGAMRRPELYRCAVSVAGVCDLAEMMKYERLDGDDTPVYQYWLKTIGDPQVDAAKLRAASPRFGADAIVAPVLLIHGDVDDVVPPNQSRMMFGALRAAGKKAEHVELKNVGHGDWEADTLRTVLESSAAFISKAFA
jgi:dipeptidyl aminopeptidase/acylaminoacyl peptidase